MAWQRSDALHLKAPAEQQAFDLAPRAMILEEGHGLRRSLLLRRLDHLLDVLSEQLFGDQNGVVHCHRDDVATKVDDLQPFDFRAQQRVGAINRGRRTDSAAP